MKVYKTKKQGGKALLLLLTAALFFLPSASIAEDVAGAVEALRLRVPKKGDKNKEWGKDCLKALDFIAAMNKELHQLSLAVEAGFYGHKAGEDNLYKLNIASLVSKDIFPHAFTFKAGSSVQYLDSSLKEDVTTLLFNYERYISEQFMFYGFFERFSDSYLSIQQRYEIGCGFMLEFDFGIAKRIKQEICSYKKNAKTFDKFREYIEKDPVEEKKSLLGKLSRVERRADTIKKNLKKKYSILSLGLAFTLFSELENAEINTTCEEVNADGETEEVSKKFPLPGEQRFRFVLRPSLILHPLNNVTVRGHIYFKLPIGRPYLVNDVWDIRTDSLVRLEYNLAKGDSWAKKVSIILEYQRHQDNLPPTLPESILSDYVIVGRTAAEKIHDEFFLKLAVQF